MWLWGCWAGRSGNIVPKPIHHTIQTAANTDARVIKVMVELDEASSGVAARYTNLEVIARIDTRTVATTAKSNP